MSSFKPLLKPQTEIATNKLDNSIFAPNSRTFMEHDEQAKVFPKEKITSFLMCKCIALEDINLDSELRNKPHLGTEINNYIYYYNNGIKRSFNKDSKKLLLDIPDFQLE